MVAEGELREDLYFRLQVITVELPPVRERREDIPLLVGHFLEKFGTEEGRPVFEVPPEVMNRFLDYSWPGNVREIENEVRRLVTLADSAITLDLLSPHIREGREQFASADTGPIRNLNARVEEVESLEILKALEHFRNNKTRAAEALGISRFTLQRKLEKYGMIHRDATGRAEGRDPDDAAEEDDPDRPAADGAGENPA
jgi:Nif-specific regulatory protein